MRLGDALKQLEHSSHFRIIVDHAELAKSDISVDSPVNVPAKNISLGTSLRLILDDLDLAFAVENSGILITSHTEADSRLVVRSYPVQDLVLLKSNKDEADFYSLVNAIRILIQPKSWEEFGGQGLVQKREKELVVLNSYVTHQRIGQLLSALRSLNDREDKQIEVPEANAKLRKALDGLTEFNSLSMTIGEMIETISANNDIAIHVDHKALTTLGLDAESPILDRNVRDISVRSLLKIILNDLGLVAFGDNDVLRIVAGETTPRLIIYDVSEFMRVDVEERQIVKNMKDLTLELQSRCDRRSWDKFGGTGYLLPLPAKRCLIGSNAIVTHWKVQEYLANLRNGKTTN